MYSAILRVGRLVRTAAPAVGASPQRSMPFTIACTSAATASLYANRAVDVIDPVKAFR
jgi:hypothetical protein